LIEFSGFQYKVIIGDADKIAQELRDAEAKSDADARDRREPCVP